MACNCGGNRRVTVHESHRPDGQIKRYLTEVEARRDVEQYGGTYSQVTQKQR